MKDTLVFKKQCIVELSDATLSDINSGGTPTVTATIVVGAPVSVAVTIVGIIIYTIW